MFALRSGSSVLDHEHFYQGILEGMSGSFLGSQQADVDLGLVGGI